MRQFQVGPRELWPLKRVPGKRGPTLAVALCFLALTIALQWKSGAYRTERGSFPDEAAHFVTSLMVRDYLVSGFASTPLQFAKDFYVHYPKVAFGMWPPLLHLALGVWMIPAPHSHSAALLFMALLTALLAVELFRALLARFGFFQAAAMGILFLTLPLVMASASAVMADMLVALLSFLTAMRTVHFFETGSTRDGLLLGLCAGLACMAKGNGMAAILGIALAIGFARRFDLFQRPGLYWAALVTMILSLPWEALSLYLFRKNSSFQPAGWRFTGPALALYCGAIFDSLGPFLLAVILAGILLKISAIFRERDPFWTSMFAFALATILFHATLPQPPDGRYMTAMLPPLLAFVPVALNRFAGLARLSGRSNSAALCAVFLVTLAARPLRIPARETLGYREIVDWLCRQRDFTPNHPVLVVSDGEGEGALVAEVAARDQRPQHFVLRGNKLLGSSDFQGNHYHLVFARAGDALSALENLGARYLVLDRTDPKFRMTVLPHHEQVLSMAEAFPSRMKLVCALPRIEGQRERSLEIYRLPNSTEKRTERIQVSVQFTIGGVLAEPAP